MSAAPKDPAIKLFGKTIPLPDSLASVDDHRSPLHHRISNYVTEKENSVAKLDAIDHKDEAGPLRTADERTKVEKNKEEKTLQKPDKIIPCPRCTSMDTKFCYYNNYNVNQPRHFCKNCQRYWTAGGNIRNVPIGAGRRKSKNSVSTYQSQADVVNAFHQRILRPNKGIDTVLAFGSDNLPCESMTSTLNLAEKPILTSNSRIGNFQISVPEGGRQSDNDTSRSSNETVNNTTKIPSEVPYCSGPLWPYSWNPARWSRQLPHPSTVCAPGFSMPCHPAVAYSGCTVPGTWNSPWLARLPSPIQKGQESGPVSTKMGKHLRDENIGSLSISEFDEKHKQKSLHKCFWVPKTLRIGESETTKSSLWETQGMKSEKGESTNYTGLADTFHRDPNLPNSALQANPAALSRSLKFHESS